MPDLNPHDACGTDCGVEVCGSVNGDIDDDDCCDDDDDATVTRWFTC